MPEEHIAINEMPWYRAKPTFESSIKVFAYMPILVGFTGKTFDVKLT